MFNLTEYRVIIQGMLITVADLEDASQKIDNILAGRISAYNYLELAAYRDDFKDAAERLGTALIEFRKRSIADRIKLVNDVRAVRRHHRLKTAETEPNIPAKEILSGPTYCPGCGMLADTFCECGFTDSSRGVA